MTVGEKKLIDAEVVDYPSALRAVWLAPLAGFSVAVLPVPSRARRDAGRRRTVSESFLAASRMIPGDYDSWHKEWMVVADNNMRRGEAEESKGHYPDAMNAICAQRICIVPPSSGSPGRSAAMPTFESVSVAFSQFVEGRHPPRIVRREPELGRERYISAAPQG